MLTRCPFCQTVFQVTDEQLARAHGLARCGECEEVFDAAENVCTEDTTPLLADKDTLSGEHEYDWRPAASDEEQPAPEATPEVTQADWVETHDDFLIPPKIPDPGKEEAPEPVNRDIGNARADDKAVVHMAIDKGSSEINEVPLEIRDDVVAQKYGTDRSYTRWLAGSLLLTLLLGIQFIWFQRDELANRYPDTRGWLTGFCELAGCKLAPVWAPDKIQIISRELRYHPGNNKAILARLTIANVSGHDQPWPVIQLVLSNHTTGFRAMRRFTVDDYLPAGKRPATFPADTPVNVSLEIMKPGKPAPDYVFSFLPPPAQ